MDLAQTQNALKQLSDNQLQQELLQPTGQIPSFMVLSELQRRKDIRATANQPPAPPQQSMAQEMGQQPQGMGAAQGRYAQAITGATAPQQGPPAQAMQANPGAQMPPQMQQGYAYGGVVRLAGGGDPGDTSPWYPSLSRNPWASSTPYVTLPQILQGITGQATSQYPNGQLPSHWDQAVPPGTTVDQPPQGDLLTPSPGMSLGQTLSQRLQGKPVNIIPPGASTPGDEGVNAGMNITALTPQQIPLIDQESQSGVQPGAYNQTPQSQPYGGGDIYPDPSMAAGAGGAPSGAPGPNPMRGAPAPGGMPAGGGGGAGGLRGAAGGPGGSPLAQRANQSLGDFYSEIQGLNPQDRFADLQKANQADRDQLDTQHQNDRGMALLQAGLGIMAGQSPFAAVNIGQGAQAGVKYWQQAQNEMRQAQRDIRNSDQQVAIAQANNDQHSADTAARMKIQSEENYQRSLDRANSAGVAAANRAAALDLKKMEIEDNAKNRAQALDESRISHFENLSRSYYTQAQQSRTKLLELNGKIQSGGMDPNDPEVRGQINDIQDEIKRFGDMGNMYQKNARDATLDRERRLGNIKTYNSQADVNAAKLPRGTIYFDGQNYRQAQ